MLEKIAHAEIIPAIRDISVMEGRELISSLASRGYEAFNISQQSENGAVLLAESRRSFPNLILGGGNVRTADEAERALSAGAQFILSPLFDPEMISLVSSAGILILPVIIDGHLALEYHLEAVSLYPVKECGGVARVNELWENHSIRSFIAGGLDETSLKPYQETGGFLAATGTWML